MFSIAVRVLAFGCICCAAYAQEKSVLPADPAGVIPGLKLRFSCGPVRTGMPMAELTWSAAGQPARIGRVDVTAFRDGFETGKYATASPPAVNSKLVLHTQAANAQPAGMGLNGLEIEEVKMPSGENGVFSLKMGNIQPNIVYSFRVLTELAAGWAPSQVVRGSAPVCPADMVKKAPKP